MKVKSETWVCPTKGCEHTQQQPFAVEIWHYCKVARKRVALHRAED